LVINRHLTNNPALYVVFSILLWRAAINANRQAERANREAQKAFELTRELWRAIYRPFLAVASPVVEERLGQYVIEITIENKSDIVEARIGGCH
jgi:hypothetical protein